MVTLLRGIDFHEENIFCVNSTPAIIERESLFYPGLTDTKDHDIAATSMLPTELNKQSVMSHLEIQIDDMIQGVASACNTVNAAKNKIRELIDSGNKKLRRIILKPTKFYYKVLRASMHPGRFTDRAKRTKYISDF